MQYIIHECYPSAASKFHGTLESILVKQKRKVKIGMEYSLRLQGLVYFGAVEEAKSMGLSVGDWVKRLVELELLRQGRLPDWWYTRKFR